MLWPAANLIAFAMIPQVRREKEKSKRFFARLNLTWGFTIFVFFSSSLPSTFIPLLLPTQPKSINQDLRILYSNAIGVAWCAYVSLSLAASAAGGSLPPPPPPPFDKPLV
jgi:hypothetical protein